MADEHDGRILPVHIKRTITTTTTTTKKKKKKKVSRACRNRVRRFLSTALEKGYHRNHPFTMKPCLRPTVHRFRFHRRHRDMSTVMSLSPDTAFFFLFPPLVGDKWCRDRISRHTSGFYDNGMGGPSLAPKHNAHS